MTGRGFLQRSPVAWTLPAKRMPKWMFIRLLSDLDFLDSRFRGRRPRYLGYLKPVLIE